MAPSTPAVTAHSCTLAELAERTGAALEGDGAIVITHVAPLDAAGPGAIAFLTNPKYRGALAATGASAVIVDPQSGPLTTLPRLVHRNPYATYARVATILYPRPAPRPGVHPSAVVAGNAQVAPSASIAAFAVVGAGAVIGERVEIGAGCVIEEGVALGDDVLLHPRVTVHHRCIVGPRTILHSGAVIGADGFGNADDRGRWIKIPQLGRVVIGADVEIGANTTVDRGALGDTLIEDDVRIDNQVQIGHNCRVGRHTAIAGCVGIAGSVNIGRNCLFGGAAMINGHIDICDDVVVAAATGVMTSIDKPGVYTGSFPAIEHMAWKRMQIELRRLTELARRLRALEKSTRARDAAGTRDAAQREEP